MTKSALYNKYFEKLVTSIESLSGGPQIFVSLHSLESRPEAFSLQSLLAKQEDNSSIVIQIIDENKFKYRFDGGPTLDMSGGLEKAGTLIKAWFKTVAPGREAELEALLAPPAPVAEPAPAPVAPPKRKKWLGVF